MITFKEKTITLEPLTDIPLEELIKQLQAIKDQYKEPLFINAEAYHFRDGSTEEIVLEIGTKFFPS